MINLAFVALDLNLVAGVRATFGSKAFESFVPQIDDNVTSLLRRAGMPILGKTNTPEFGAACYTEPDVAPPARTPWDLQRSAGGSSGGAATATASGLVPVAHGSDAAGSVRIPASVCGVVGVKPSRSMISVGPVSAETTGLFCNGVLARDVLDAAAMLDVLSVPVPGDPWHPPARPESFVQSALQPRGRMRVGRYLQPFLSDVPVDVECELAWESASKALEQLGHEVEDVHCPFPSETEPILQTLFSMSAGAVALDPAVAGRLRPLTRWLREQASAVSGPALLQTLSAAQQLSRAALAAMAQYDVILTPTLAQPPALIGAFRDDVRPQADFERQKRFSPYAALYNLTGQPAVSLPLHWSDEGLPIGVMLAAKPGRDSLMLGLAHQLEVALPRGQRQHSLW